MQKTILLVDDDEDEFFIFNVALEMTNNRYTCIWTDKLENAVQLLQDFKPEIVLIDINMPKHNGFICLEELKKCDPLNYSLFIMYSTCIEQPDSSKAMELGAYQCLHKTQSIDVLKNQLIKLLNETACIK